MKHILLALLALHQLPLYAADAPFVAAGKVDITPASGTPMAGFYAMRESVGVLEPLFAKVIVVEQGGEKAVFVVRRRGLYATRIGSRDTRIYREADGHSRGAADDLCYAHPQWPNFAARLDHG